MTREMNQKSVSKLKHVFTSVQEDKKMSFKRSHIESLRSQNFETRFEKLDLFLIGPFF
jgi:hypothetical protein